MGYTKLVHSFLEDSAVRFPDKPAALRLREMAYVFAESNVRANRSGASAHAPGLEEGRPGGPLHRELRRICRLLLRRTRRREGRRSP
ncbi:MAG: hypothetical protein MZU79_06020 [Anaerotruncus sp.]|nr:hypothetical protein [Anaerotruncus sp.]